MIPCFQQRSGYLPAGIHSAVWSEVPSLFGGNSHRQQLIAGLRLGLRNLAGAGCRSVLVDGSFVTAKDLPNDYDAAWEMLGVDPNRLDPVFFDFRNSRAAMKLKFRGEFFPADLAAKPGILYRDFFMRDKNGMPKGLIQLDPVSAL
jgi:hypothetical protein